MKIRDFKSSKQNVTESTNTDPNVTKYLITDGGSQHFVLEYPNTPGSNPRHLKKQIDTEAKIRGVHNAKVVAQWTGDIDTEINTAKKIAASYEKNKDEFPTQYYDNVKKAESLEKAKVILAKGSLHEGGDIDSVIQNFLSKKDSVELDETHSGPQLNKPIHEIMRDIERALPHMDEPYGVKEKVLDAIDRVLYAAVNDQTMHEDEQMDEKSKGLYYNVNKRKKAGTSRPKGHPNAPSEQDWKDAAKTAKESALSENDVDFVDEVTLEDDQDFHEEYGNLAYCEQGLFEAEYRGRKVKLNKPMRGDVKKFKVYVKNDKGNVVKVNFGQKGMRIKKSNPGARKSFRARHNCENPGPKYKARYWSCRAW